MKRILLTLFAVVTAGVAVRAQDTMKDCPMHQLHQTGKPDQHDHDLAQRGDQGMGFAQNKTTHHFLLRADGGVIQVVANSEDDKSSIAQIRLHLEHISRAFHSGDFNIPMFVHDQTPPGVATMIRLNDQIEYKYQPLENGGRVTISSQNAEAVTAVQDFLRFQIKEHKTGDALEVR